jgi:(R,R)-butanediol dehydrogenase/meso-butanediol dehydrogenase/diacetyl reductase
VKVQACGICGSDMAEFREGPLFIPEGTPHPLTGQAPPIVLGHEVCGEVVAAGSRQERHLVGRLVAIDGLINCGHCWACLRHRVNLCEQLASIGFSADGGLASHMNVAARGCVPLPAALSPEAGALAEPLSVGVRALRRGRLTKGERLAVVGGGAVGQLTAQAAAAMGASTVVLLEPDNSRRDLARQLGVHEVAGPEAASEVKADVVVDCSGTAAGVMASFAATRPAGRIVLVGFVTGSLPLSLLALVRGEKELIGSLSHVYDEDFATAVDLLGQGQVGTGPLISVVSDLEQAHAYITGGPPPAGSAVKMVVRPGAVP